MTWRSEYRAAARAALEAVPRFAEIPVERSWAGNVDDGSLPIMGVVTASEGIQPGSSGQFERGTLLQVALKRKGGISIEDDLDHDAEAIEAAIFAALMKTGTQCFPTEVSFMISGDGQQRVGTVVVSFRITSWRAAPAV